MATIQEYWAIVERATVKTNVPTVRKGRRDGLHYLIKDPTDRTPEELDDMIEELRDKLGLTDAD